jgi:hypothetical protein
MIEVDNLSERYGEKVAVDGLSSRSGLASWLVSSARMVLGRPLRDCGCHFRKVRLLDWRETPRESRCLPRL